MNLFKFPKLLKGPPPKSKAVAAAIANTEAALAEVTGSRETVETELQEALLAGNADAVAEVRSRLTAAQDEAESHRLGLAALQSRLAEAEEAEEQARVAGVLKKAKAQSDRGREIIGEYGNLAGILADLLRELDTIEHVVVEANRQAAEAGFEERVPSPNEAVRIDPTGTFASLPPLTQTVVLPPGDPNEFGVWPVGLTARRPLAHKPGVFPEPATDYANQRDERVGELLQG